MCISLREAVRLSREENKDPAQLPKTDRQFFPQSLCEQLQCGNGRTAAAVLDAADIGLADAGALSEFFLGHIHGCSGLDECPRDFVFCSGRFMLGAKCTAESDN